jgi:hypothetical protein
MLLTLLSVAVDGLLDLRRRLPSVEALRPRSCPGCGRLARDAGKPALEIVGHGTYERQVLGVDAPGGVVIPVRRYLCCGCRATTSVLPDLLYPGRWYGAWVILEALVLVFALGLPIAEARRELGVETSTLGWRSVHRWRRELLSPLWAWLARGLGARGPCMSRDEARRRLARLLGQVGERAGRGVGARAAPLLAHSRPVADPREGPE